ncbi:MAG: hypothetical protein JW722_04170 [Demequinaceae bacterium]|nr:hypothetical protein [Demequinaceae bacterium]
MADGQQPVSRRARREAQARPQASQASGEAASSSTPSASEKRASPGGMAPEIHAGLEYSSELPTSEVAAAFAELEPDPPEASKRAEASQKAEAPQESDKPLSRRDRRRLERLEHPMETWTAEEETRHTGQVPAMTPEAISHQEELARQKAAAAQEEARAASGGIPVVNRVSMREPQQAASDESQQPRQGTPGEPQQPPQAIPPGGPRPVPVPPAPATPLVVPQLAGSAASGGASPGVPQGGMPPQAPQPAPPTLGAQAAGFETLVAGASAPPQPKPPTVSVPQVAGPFMPPGSAPEGDAFAPPGQGMIVPGTGTLQSATGTLRTVPGTGAIPRPMVEIHPAGGVRHFGWPQLLLLAAAAFALGVVIWNVAARSS